MTPPPPRTPDWLLERILLEELPADELARARARLEAEPEGQERLARLRQDNRATLDAYPPAQVVAGIRERAERARVKPASLGPRTLWLGAPALAAAAGLWLWVGSREEPDQAPPAQVEVTRTKGVQPKLLVFRSAGAMIEELEAGNKVSAGDLLQLRLRPAGRRYGLVLSIDGGGAITRHLPIEGDTAAPLQPSGELALPSSYELDDAPGFERFYLIVAPEPFALAPLLAQAVRLASRPDPEGLFEALPAGAAQHAVTLYKARP